MHSVTKFSHRGVLVILMPGKKGFGMLVPVCVLLRNNLRNGVLACSVTKIPLDLTNKIRKLDL
jgi:hypothetical protein